MITVNILSLDSPPSLGITPPKPYHPCPRLSVGHFFSALAKLPFLQLHSGYTTLSPVAQISLKKNRTPLQCASQALTLVLPHWSPLAALSEGGRAHLPDDLNTPRASQSLLIKSFLLPGSSLLEG